MEEENLLSWVKKNRKNDLRIKKDSERTQKQLSSYGDLIGLTNSIMIRQ